MQLIAQDLGGKVHSAKAGEYGLNQVNWKLPFVKGEVSQKVWMSHGDIVDQAPPGFEVVATSSSGHPAAMRGDGVWALQFHPEVSHTERGGDLLKEFATGLCGAEKNWKPEQIVEEILEKVRKTVPQEEHVLCALSGGVDSTVVGTLLTRALSKERVHCVFVNNGLLRKNEYEDVLTDYIELGLNVKGIDASQEFLKALSGADDPERKRRIIGNLFIEIFDRNLREEEKKYLGKAKWLAQGTLYPDVIESVSPRGTSVTIKTHHNVGGLPEKMNLKLIEPLRELFKDEVRAIGKLLGLPPKFLGRHPFPGPGLAVRILGPVSEADLQILRDCDAVFIREIKKAGIYDQIWQAFTVLLPVRSVGVQGDGRTYSKVVALRAVTSLDGMTADWYPFSIEFLRHVSNCITNEVRQVNRVVYDVTSKPPGTIEWE
jgi:GMP synthase (glutamine-hydrolysing)